MLWAVSAARPRVLIVEDDDGVRHALERGLAHNGFESIGARTGDEALSSSETPDSCDIVLVDLGLPDVDGVELCRQLKRRFAERPIIVVTARRDELDVVDALDAGADDFVTKPFSLAVLTARIRRHLDRSSGVIAVGALRVDRRARQATLAGEVLRLTPREFDLLTALASHTGETISKQDLIASVWDAHWSKSTHTLAVHISSLRTKLSSAHVEAPAIATVAGVGYRLDPVPSNR